MNRFPIHALFPYILCAVFVLTLQAHSVFAQESTQVSTQSAKQTIEYSLPYPGILPNHPLYFLKRVRDSVLLFFTREPVKKSELHLLLSDKKAAMSQILWDNKTYDLSVVTLNDSENHLLSSCKILIELKTSNLLPSGYSEKLSTAIRKHEEILQDMTISDPEMKHKQAFERILSIIETAKRCNSSLK